jgi:hypothetical protein
MVEDPDVGKVGSIAYEAIIPIWGGGEAQLWLESFLGFEPRMVMLKLKID